MVYTPLLIQETELRDSFSPAISISDYSSSGVLAIIEMTETYIKDVFFDGTMPASSVAKVPALMICMSKLMSANPAMAKSYKPIESFKIDNYSVKYESSNYVNELFNTASRMLLTQDMKNRSEYIIKCNR